LTEQKSFFSATSSLPSPQGEPKSLLVQRNTPVNTWYNHTARKVAITSTEIINPLPINMRQLRRRRCTRIRIQRHWYNNNNQALYACGVSDGRPTHFSSTFASQYTEYVGRDTSSPVIDGFSLNHLSRLASNVVNQQQQPTTITTTPFKH
jgi:hypothetical protein